MTSQPFRRCLLSFEVACALLLSAATAWAQGTVSGTVRSTASGNPGLSGITVQLVSTSNGFVSRSTSTASGGTYTIITGSTPIVISGAPQTGKNFLLSAGGTISGTVKDTSNNNISNASVLLYDATTGSQVASTGVSGGNYALTGVPAGNYKLGTSNSSGFINQIFNGKSFSGFASTQFILAGDNVPATAGQTTPINFTLVAGATISGTVKDTANANVTSGSVILYDSTTGSQVGSTGINAGTYSLTGLAAGNYKMGTSNTGLINQVYNGKEFSGFVQTSFILTGDNVTATAGQPASINFVLNPAATISGTVTTGGSTGVSGVSLQLLNSSNVFVSSQATSASGTFTFTGLFPGNYALKTQNSGGVGAGYIDKAYTSNPAGGVPCNNSCNATQIANAIFAAAAGANAGKNIDLVVGGKISGTVTQDGGTNGALGGIQVQAYAASQQFGQFLGSATTAADGTYAIGGLGTLAYTVKTSNTSGFLDELYNNIPCTICSTNAGQNIPVTAGATTSGINFALVQGGTIKGKVTNASTTLGVGNMQVQFYNSAGVSVGSANSSNQSATLGEYTSPGFSNGSYFAATNGFNTGFINRLYNGIDCLGCTNPVNGVSGALNGTPIPVTTGSSTTGINFALTTGLSISGQVTNKDTTAGIQNVRVQVHTSASGTSSLGSATTDASGNYSITGLPAGTYFVKTNGLNGPGTFQFINQVFKSVGSVTCGSSCKPSEFGTGVAISAGTGSAWGPVAQASATGINISLPSGGSITGTVTSSNSGASGVQMNAFDVNNANSSIAFATTAADGTYTMSGLPTGQYYVKALPPATSGLIGQIANGKTCLNCQSTTGDKIPVTAGSATPVNFALISGGTITGTVKSSASGNPTLSGISVTLSTATNSFVTSVSTNASGVFTLAGLPAGTYYLRTSNSQGYLDTLYDNLPCTNCSNASAGGTPIVVAVGDTKTANFILTLGSKISGTISDAATGDPIPGVQVSIYNSAGSFLTSGNANDAGVWTTQGGLAAGTYFAKTSAGTSSGIYINKVYNNINCTNCLASTGTSIPVVAGSNVSGINFALAAGGRVTGTVSDANGPVAGISVNIYTAQADPQTKSVVFLGSGFTGANGAYAVTGLPGGSVVERTSNQLGYIDEVYNDVTCLNCNVTIGQPFNVTVGSTTPNINFVLVAGARITGTIKSSASGNPPISNVGVQVFSNSSGTSPVGSASSNSSGVYTTGGLPPGTYFIKTSNANNSGFVNQLFELKPCANCQASTGTPIILAAGAIGTANFTLTAGASISGSVIEGDGEYVQQPTTNDAGVNAVGGPIAGVSINLYDSGNSFVTSIQTSATGTFTLSGLAAGTYYAKTSNTQGWIDKMYDNVNCTFCSLTGGLGITVGATEAKTGIGFSLIKGGTISGTITDGNAAPLAGMSVILFGASGQSLKSTQTNGLGQYSLAGLSNGTFYVKTTNSLGYIDELYNDIACAQCNTTTGAPIKLTSAARNAAGINFSLAVGGLITGTVLSASNTPIENVTVQVYASGGGAPVASGYTIANGVYKTSGLPGGTYFVRTSNSKGFIDQLYDGKPCSFCNPNIGTPVTVTLGQTTDGINFTLPAGGRIAGAVTSGGVGVPGVSVTIFNAAGQSVANGFTDGTGSYTTFGGFPAGTYYARTSNSAGLVDEIYDDITCPACNPNTGKPIAVVTGATTSGISFALIAGSRVEGTVTDKTSGLPIANARVDVFSSNGYYVTFANTGSAGTYITAGGLSAGTYYVRGVAGQGYVGKMYNDIDCPACAPFKGTPVVVAAKQTTSGIDFALTKGGLVSGNVTDATTGAAIGSTDIGSVTVQFYNSSNQFVASALVDASGRYTTNSGLPSGTYYGRTFNTLGYINKLYNKSTACLGDSGGGKAVGGGGGGGIGAPSCIPSTGDAVTINVGQTTTGINFSLAAGARIGGTITDVSTNLPIANASVLIFDSAGKPATSGRTDNAGKYTSFGGLPPGTYYATAQAGDQGYYWKLYNNLVCLACSVTTGQPIVLFQSRSDVDFALEKGGSFSGSVKAASNNAALGNLKLSLYSSTGSFIGNGRTDADGTFTATGIPAGSYFLRTFNLLGYVDQAYLNKACAPCPISASTPIVVAANAATTGIDFLLVKGGLVSGFIADANGIPLQGVAVKFFKTDGTFVGQSGLTDDVGYYAISLPVGTYNATVDGVAGFQVTSSGSARNGITQGQISTVSVSEGGESELAVTMSACTAPTVSPATLTNLSIGVPFSLTLTAAGGSGPYRFSVADGTLAPGLALNATTGVISGTPTTRGTANFTVGATGSNDCSGTTSYAQVTLGVTLNQAGISVSGSAGSGTLAVVAEASGVKWNASSDSSWLTLSASSGTGSGTLTYTIAANTGASRTGTITVSGETFMVTQARSNRPRIALDAPQNGQALSRNFVVSGWALDLDATDVGVDAVHVYAYPIVNGALGSAIFLGAASGGGARADVAAAFGTQFTNSGFGLSVTGLPAGSYRIVVYARTSLTELFQATQSANVTVSAAGASPAMSIDGPAANATVGETFIVGGWAVDRGATSGVGVDAVHVWAYPIVSGALRTPTFIGEAALGGGRADVGAVFGAQFATAGFNVTGGGLSAGRYRIAVFARSTVTGTFNQSATSDVTVDVPIPNPAMNIDGPANGSTQMQPFLLGGWAIDRGARNGTGVDAVHVYAFNVNTGDTRFVGVASYGGTRGDVAAAFGTQFAASGYSISVADLPAGTYGIGVYMHSGVSGTFNLVKFVRVTVQ